MKTKIYLAKEIVQQVKGLLCKCKDLCLYSLNSRKTRHSNNLNTPVMRRELEGGEFQKFIGRYPGVLLSFLYDAILGE